ncbi:MAG: HAMP domain-containing sensor histidine kinase [Chloroflexota bacterium]
MKVSRLVRFRNGAIAATTVVTIMVGGFTLAFFLTAAIYERTGLQPSAWLLQIINLLLGLFIGFNTMGLIVSLLRARGWTPEAQAFGPIMSAMQQIAQGNFNIRLDNNFAGSEPFGNLVDGMNTMALQLGEMEQMRQEFISNVSHEIQSPLTSIRGFAQALHDEQLSDEQKSNYLDIIMNESMRLSRLSDNLLRLASLEAKHPRFEPHPYRLDKQIRDIILACEPQWTDKSLDMDVCLERVSITADEDLLSQVWINLISNCIKFTPGGGTVRVELSRDRESIIFRTTDTGIGIAMEDQPHLFERFYKADKSRTYSNGGSGLGLSIAKKIVEMHNGSIDVKSSPGAGAIFTVCLPESRQDMGSEK